MGFYISTAKVIELPFRSAEKFIGEQLCFDEKSTKEEIITAIANSNISHIQTTYEPSEEELEILNEIFKRKPDLGFRHYWGIGEEFVDISYLSKLPNLRRLFLNIYPEIKNIEVLQKLELYGLEMACFSVKDYGFLKGVCSSLKYLTINLEDKTYKMDLQNICHMKELEGLAIRNVKKGLDKLVEFKHLKELSLRSIDIKDYSFLKKTDIKKIYLSFQNATYFNTFDVNEKIEEVALWRNRKLTDLNFLLQFPSLKRIKISSQGCLETIPDLTQLKKLQEVYFLDGKEEKLKKCFGEEVKIYTQYNPADLY